MYIFVYILYKIQSLYSIWNIFVLKHDVPYILFKYMGECDIAHFLF